MDIFDSVTVRGEEVEDTGVVKLEISFFNRVEVINSVVVVVGNVEVEVNTVGFGALNKKGKIENKLYVLLVQEFWLPKLGIKFLSGISEKDSRQIASVFSVLRPAPEYYSKAILELRNHCIYQ